MSKRKTYHNYGTVVDLDLQPLSYCNTFGITEPNAHLMVNVIVDIAKISNCNTTGKTTQSHHLVDFSMFSKKSPRMTNILNLN